MFRINNTLSTWFPCIELLVGHGVLRGVNLIRRASAIIGRDTLLIARLAVSSRLGSSTRSLVQNVASVDSFVVITLCSSN